MMEAPLFIRLEWAKAQRDRLVALWADMALSEAGNGEARTLSVYACGVVERLEAEQSDAEYRERYQRADVHGWGPAGHAFRVPYPVEPEPQPERQLVLATASGPVDTSTGELLG